MPNTVKFGQRNYVDTTILVAQLWHRDLACRQCYVYCDEMAKVTITRFSL